MTRLGGLVHARPRVLLAVAAAVAVLAALFAGGVEDRLEPYVAEDPATEAARSTDRLEQATGIAPDVRLVVLIRAPELLLSSPPAQGRVAGIAAKLRSEPLIGRVVSYREAGAGLVSRDGRSTYVVANFKPGRERARQDAAKRLSGELGALPGVSVGGVAATYSQLNETVREDILRAELIAFPLIFLLSLLFLRSLVAALLPPLVGGLSIATTLLFLRLATEVTTLSIFALNIVTALGLGLAIDYTLLIVSRYREELAVHGPGAEALRRTLQTAGRTVLFSSITVAAAVASLLVFPQQFLASMGLGGAIVALLAAAIALTVLPAILALLGPRVNALAPRRLQRAAELEATAVTDGRWYRLARLIARRPLRIAITITALLLALGLPLTSVTFTQADERVLPAESDPRRVGEALRSDFDQSRLSPMAVAIDAPLSPAVNGYAARLARLPGVAGVTEPRAADARTSTFEVIPATPAVDPASQDLLREVRDAPAPFDALVGGQTADFVDTRSSLGEHMPLAVAIVVLSTMIMLFLMTGSVVLPLKTLVMNVLTLSAVLGILVLVFQDGRLEGLLAYEGQGAIDLTQPVLLFAVLFGLSTDYGVFLLSRIKEARDAGRSESEAVAVGLERTGRIVTAAALLFCVALGAFATSRIVFIKEIGIGAALAVLIDATLVRALLVPSLMEMLGRWNWWAPGPLRRLHDRIGLREGEPPPEPAEART